MNRPTSALAARLAAPPALVAFAAFTALAGLSACGGGADAEADTQTTAAAARLWAPLLDDEGGAMPTDPSALPADPAARALSARHATPEQAAALESARPGGVVPVVVEGAEAEDQAIAIAQAVQAGADLGDDAPVLVYGTDARAVARTADRMLALGHQRVWAVTP